MNTSEVISLCSSIAAFITSGITYLNVKEVKKQRIQSLRPDIIVNQAYFDMEGLEPIKWMRIDGKSDDKSSVDELGIMTLIGFNIGLGAAKKISLNWSYDVETFISLIHGNNNENAYQINYDEAKLMQLSIDSKIISSMSSKLEKEVVYDYLMPASIDKQEIKIKVPSGYTDLCSILLDLYTSSKRQNDSLLDWPPLLLTITYQDIGNKTYTKELRIKIVLYTILPKEKSVFSGDGVLKIEYL